MFLLGTLKTSEWKPRLEGYDFLAKIKEDAESGEGQGDKDPWDENETTEGDDNDPGKGSEESTVVSESSRDSHGRIHAAFHAKKESRLDQRRRITQKPVHAELHTEL